VHAPHGAHMPITTVSIRNPCATFGTVCAPPTAMRAQYGLHEPIMMSPPKDPCAHPRAMRALTCTPPHIRTSKKHTQPSWRVLLGTHPRLHTYALPIRRTQPSWRVLLEIHPRPLQAVRSPHHKAHIISRAHTFVPPHFCLDSKPLIALAAAC
jgi:hypothetical protein